MKRISFFSLMAFVTIIADIGPAKAALDYSIYESLGNLVIQASGSLNLPAPSTGNGICSQDGMIVPFFQSFCTGPAASNLKRYNFATGPNSFMGGNSIAPASSVSGETMMFWAANPIYAMFLPNAYVSGTPIVRGAIFKRLVACPCPLSWDNPRAFSKAIRISRIDPCLLFAYCPSGEASPITMKGAQRKG